MFIHARLGHRSSDPRRHLLRAALTAMAAVGPLALSAPSAHAATPIPVTCTEASITLYGSVGDEFEFSGGGVCNDDWEFYNTENYNTAVPGWLEYRSNVNMVNVSSNLPGNPQDRWYAYFNNVSPSSVTVRLMATNVIGTPLVEGGIIAEIDNDAATGGLTTIIPIIYGGASQAAATDTDTAWTVIRQSLPLPSDGTCASISDADHAWATGLTGGWVKSWEHWVDGGNGGWACNRTLVNKSGHAWMIDNAA